MLQLPGVTIACIDTANPGLALRALSKSCQGVRFAHALLFTTADAAIQVPDPVRLVPIAPLGSRDAYSRFLLKELAPHIDTDHVLVVQWDGYVVNPDAWDPRFLDCDYLGARWYWFDDGMRVGNGGFSLRSRRLLRALQDPRIELVEAEDLTIGRTFRPLLEREHGIRFGDEALADRFAFEAAYPIGLPFGFHGLFNFCRVTPPAELAALAPRFTDAIAASPQCAQLLRNCVALAQWAPAIAIARRVLEAAPGDEARALLAQAEASLAAGVGIGRNDPCPCGSGRRYKQCHGSVAGAGAASQLPVPSLPTADQHIAAGIAAHQAGDLATAERSYRSALASGPDHPYALHLLGLIHYQRDEIDAALPMLERAAALRPGEADFHNNAGLALARAERDADAVQAFERALALSPSHAGVLNNLGLSLRALNRVDEAIAAYRRALALQPSFPEARWNLALALLAKGDFAEGWREYETRLAIDAFQSGASDVPGTRWSGGDPRGLTLLLTSEQGLGDAIHFVRLAGVLAQRGARVVVRAAAPIVRLLRTVPGVSEVVGPDEPLPAYDAHVPLLSLPGLLGLGVTDVPAPVPYIAADTALRAQVRDELASLPPGLRIGLCWAGSRRNADDRRRSIPAANLAPLLATPGTCWLSLQKGDDDALGDSSLVRLDARNTMDGTAALIAELDLVITVDTSIAHLAGALGKPVWTLLAFACDWRWGLAGSRSPWYPTMRLFRQPVPGDWPRVVVEVREALREAVAAATRTEMSG